MNENVIPLARFQNFPDTNICHNGDHLASAAAARTGRDAREIERLPSISLFLKMKGFSLTSMPQVSVFSTAGSTGRR